MGEQSDGRFKRRGRSCQRRQAGRSSHDVQPLVDGATAGRRLAQELAGENKSNMLLVGLTVPISASDDEIHDDFRHSQTGER